MTKITSDKCRAGRAMLNWTQIVLADKAGVAASTVNLFENNRNRPREDTLAAIEKAFMAAGLAMTDVGIERVSVAA